MRALRPARNCLVRCNLIVTNLKARLNCLAFFNAKSIQMGRGDIKTKKGKIFAGSFGKSRPTKKATKVPAKSTEAAATETAPKKTATKKAK